MGQVVDFCAAQWPNITPALTGEVVERDYAIELTEAYERAMNMYILVRTRFWR